MTLSYAYYMSLTAKPRVIFTARRTITRFLSFRKGLHKSCQFVWSENVVAVGSQNEAYIYRLMFDVYAWSSQNHGENKR